MQMTEIGLKRAIMQTAATHTDTQNQQGKN